MSFSFVDLCRRSDADYMLLRQRTDTCAQAGRSYEIPCLLPNTCTPADVTLGFCRVGSRYLLYTRPQVCYHGHLASLAELFSPGMRTFPDFPAMIARLRQLGRELCGTEPADRQDPPLFRNLRAALEQQVLGQEAAVEAAAFRLYTHLSKKQPERPLSLILYGPTGTGKSELGKTITPILQRMFPQQHWQFIWTELNTFTEPHSVYRLTGSPPGYVGYDDRPVFEAVRRAPYTVFMFDELDKAHPEVLKAFMSILDEGRCAARQEDHQGQRELDFRRCIFIFTTNFDLTGTKKLRPGFASSPTCPSAISDTVSDFSFSSLPQRLLEQDDRARQAMVHNGVLREIAGRFTGLIGFRELDEASRLSITAKQIAALGREFGLQIVSIAPDIVTALTPKDSFSVRSTAAVLEGRLTPLLAAQSCSAAQRFCLSGSPERMELVAVDRHAL